MIHDRGRFAGPNAVAVNGEILEAKHIVIATGSKPRKLPFPGAEVMITSDDVLSEVPSWATFSRCGLTGPGAGTRLRG